MIDRDELLRFRIDNYLSARHARIKKIGDGVGTLVVRQASRAGYTVGWVSASGPARPWERVVGWALAAKLRPAPRDYFIEAPQATGNASARQLWLPAWQWVNEFSTARQREIVATEAEPDRRFAAWQDARPTVNDLEDYSPYEGDGRALFEQAKLILQFMSANDDGFDFSVDLAPE